MRARIETLIHRPDRSEETVFGQRKSVMLHAVGESATRQTARLLGVLGSTNSLRKFPVMEEVFPLMAVSGIPESAKTQTQWDLESAFGKSVPLRGRLFKPAPKVVVNDPEKTASLFTDHIRRNGNPVETMLHMVQYEHNPARTAEDNQLTNANVIKESLQRAKELFPNLFHVALLTFSQHSKILYNGMGSQVFPLEAFPMPVIVAEVEPASEEETALLQGMATLMAGVDAEDTSLFSPRTLQSLKQLADISPLIGAGAATSEVNLEYMRTHDLIDWLLRTVKATGKETATISPLSPIPDSTSILAISIPLPPKSNVWSDRTLRQYMRSPLSISNTRPIYASSKGNQISVVHFFPAA